MKFAMQTSSHSFPSDIRAPDFRWEKLWDVHTACVKRGFRLRIALWVAFMMLPSGSMTWGPSLIFCLLLHGVFTLI